MSTNEDAMERKCCHLMVAGRELQTVFGDGFDRAGVGRGLA